MKILASRALVAAGVVALNSDLDMEISSMIDPVFGDDLLVIVSLQGEDATSTWTVDDETSVKATPWGVSWVARRRRELQTLRSMHR